MQFVTENSTNEENGDEPRPIPKGDSQAASDLPAPLTSLDWDLRTLPSLLMGVAELVGGRLARLPSAEAYRAGIAAIAASWWQVPPASLPNDPSEQAFLCGYGRDVETWLRACAEGAIADWIQCSDGRWFHPPTAEKAREAWVQRKAYRERSKRANAARWSSKDRLEDASGSQQASNKDLSGIAGASNNDPGSDPKVEGEKIEGREESSILRMNAPRGASVSVSEGISGPRQAVWREGVAIVQRLTGKPEGPARSLIGKLLKQAKDDCAGLLLVLRECPESGDPVAWLTKAASVRGSLRQNRTEEMRHDWGTTGVIDAGFMTEDATSEKLKLTA